MQHNKYNLFYRAVKRLSSLKQVQGRYGLQILFVAFVVSIFAIFHLQKNIPKYSCHAIINLKPFFMEQGYLDSDYKDFSYYLVWLNTQKRILTSGKVLEKALDKVTQENIRKLRSNLRIFSVANTFNIKLEMHSFDKKVVQRLNNVVKAYFEYKYNQRKQLLQNFLNNKKQKMKRARASLEETKMKLREVQEKRIKSNDSDFIELSNLHTRYHSIIQDFLYTKHSLRLLRNIQSKRLAIYNQINSYQQKSQIRDYLKIAALKDNIDILKFPREVRNIFKNRQYQSEKILQEFEANLNKDKTPFSTLKYNGELAQLSLQHQKIKNERLYNIKQTKSIESNRKWQKWYDMMEQRYEKDIEFTEQFLTKVERIQQRVQSKFILPANAYFQQPALDKTPYLMRVRNWWVIASFFAIYLCVLLAYSLYEYHDLSIDFPRDIQQVVNIPLSQSLWKKNKKSLVARYENLRLRLENERQQYHSNKISIVPLINTIDTTNFNRQLLSAVGNGNLLLDLNFAKPMNHAIHGTQLSSLHSLSRLEQQKHLQQIPSSTFRFTFINCPGLTQTSISHEAIIHSDVVILLIKIRKNTWGELYKGLDVLQNLKTKAVALVAI